MTTGSHAVHGPQLDPGPHRRLYKKSDGQPATANDKRTRELTVSSNRKVEPPVAGKRCCGPYGATGRFVVTIAPVIHGRMVVNPLQPCRKLRRLRLTHDHGAEVEQLLDVRCGGVGCGVQLGPGPARQCRLCALYVEWVRERDAFPSQRFLRVGFVIETARHRDGLGDTICGQRCYSLEAGAHD